jgi:acyl carrier protein
MPDDELTAHVLRLIAETQRRDPATVSIDNTFDELNIDSMDAVNIVFAVENEFNIDVPDDDVRTIRTVRDVVDGVRRLVAAKVSPAS